MSIVFHSGEVRFAGARETDNTGRTVTFDLILTAAQQRMANPFSVATRRRGKKAGTRFSMTLVPVEGPRPEEPFTEEVMLLGWSDGPKGSTATFLLEDHGIPHPFMHAPRGMAWMAAFVELSDDEQPVDQTHVEKAERHGQTLANQAAIMLKAPAFCKWLRRDYLPNGVTDMPYDEILKRKLRITSKSELDSNEEAGKRFKALRARYNAQ